MLGTPCNEALATFATTLLASEPGALPAALAATTLLAGAWTMFHSPHDVISDVQVARDASRRKTVFAVSRHNLLRSHDEQSWERLTTGLGAHKLSALAVSPAFARDATVFVASFGGGIFHSTDAGSSWQPCNVGLPQAFIVRLAIAPDFELTGVVMALGLDGIVYGSENRGATWRVAFDPRTDGVAPIPSAATNVLSNPLRDAGEAWAACHQPTGATCIACGQGIVVAGTSDGRVFATTSRIDSWTRVDSLPRERRITCIAVDPGLGGKPDCMFIGTHDEGIFALGHGAKRAANIAVPRSLQRVTALAAWRDPEGHLHLAAAGWNDALFLSQDAGQSWKRAGSGLTTHRQADEQRFGAPHFSVIALEGGQAQACYVGGFDGLFRMGEPFREWLPVETLSTATAIDLAVSPGDCAVAVSTYGAGLALQRARGAAWEWLTPSLQTTRRLGPVRFSPAYASGDPTLYVAGEAALLSWDAETRCWRRTPMTPVMGRHRSARLFQGARAAERLASRYLHARAVGFMKRVFQTTALRLGGRVSRIVFPSAIEFSAHYGTNRTLLVATREHGVFRSTDGGRTLRQVWDANGHFVRELQSAVLDATAETFYALLPDALCVSTDGGLHWSAAPTRVPGTYAALAVSPSFAHDTTLFVGSSSGLYRSIDAGRTWTELPLGIPLDGAAVSSIALSPAFGSDGLLLVYVRGCGLLRSTDGGDRFERLTWKGAACDPGFCTPICFPDSTTLVRFSPNFARDRTVFAARAGETYVSTDAGTTWSESGRSSLVD